MSSSPASPSPTPADDDALAARPLSRQESLERTLVEIEGHIDQLGWDRPVLVFALARTLAVRDSDPQVARLLPPEALQEAEANPEALTAVLQEDLPAVSTLEELLGALAWPQHVEGAAICTESTVVPAAVEQEALALTDEQEREELLRTHPERQDVRILAAVLRSGESWSVMRSRGQEELLQGESLVPQLVAGLRGTFA